VFRDGFQTSRLLAPHAACIFCVCSGGNNPAHSSRHTEASWPARLKQGNRGAEKVQQLDTFLMGAHAGRSRSLLVK
jgi:hypothetical protein